MDVSKILTGRALLDHLLDLHQAGRVLPAIAGGEPTPEEKATATGGAATTAPAPAIDPAFVAELQTLKTELAQYRAEKAAQADAAKAKEREDLLKKGQLDEIARNHEAALKAKDEALATLDKRTRSTELRRALTEALSGHELREGAMGQLLKLWGDEFQVDDDGEGFKVRCRADLRDPKAVFAERLASKDYDHFLRAGHKGGAQTASGQASATQAQAQTPSNPFLASVEFLRKQTSAMLAQQQAQAEAS